jgi:hypothetical protein
MTVTARKSSVDAAGSPSSGSSYDVVIRKTGAIEGAAEAR